MLNLQIFIVVYLTQDMYRIYIPLAGIRDSCKDLL